MKSLFTHTLIFAFLQSLAFADRDRPNIIIIMVDDMGFAGPSIAPYNNPHYKTPGMDRLASEGMRFTDFHSSGTVCSPTRAGLLTGRYQQRAGIEAVIHPHANHPEHRKWLKTSEVTFAELFQQAGYATGLVGKWHLGYPEGNDEVHPQNHGFDYFIGYHSGNIDFINHWGDHMKHDWWHGRKETVEEGYTTHLINKYALEFIEANKDKPFCLYVAHEAPHAPVQGPNDPPQRGPGRKKRITPHTEAMKQMMLEMDKGVEQVRAKLVELGLEKNTLFLFFSDNGDSPRTATGSPRFRGHKDHVYEGGTRVPAIAWWPGKIEAGSSTDALSITLDVMPTILSVAGIEPDAEKAMDGADLSPVLFENKGLEERPLFWASLSNRGSRSEAMRDGFWKLVVQHPKAKPGTFENEQVELFDLSIDEGETKNLAAEHPDRAAEMLQRIKDWYAETQETATAQPGGWSEANAVGDNPRPSSPSDHRPNIIIIMADDLGYAGPSCFGNPHFKTPEMDRLAADGMKFTDFHSSGAVCSPTRAGLLTGRYQQRTGVETIIFPWAHHPEFVNGLQPSEITFAEAMKGAGYATGIVGKWHLGYAKEFPNRQYHPMDHGFDFFRGYLSGNIDFVSHVGDHMKHDWWHDRKETREEGYTTHLINKHALDFIEQNKDRPFCLYVAHEAVHNPLQVPGDPVRRTEKKWTRWNWKEKSEAELVEKYKGMTMPMDEGIGQIRKKLAELELADNTFILFFSDNGDSREAPGGSPTLRGNKGSLFEGGHRVPAVAVWPGKIESGSRSDQTAISIDVMPTILSLAGVQLPKGHLLDGKDLSPTLLDQKPLPDRSFFWARHRGGKARAMRSGPWKLLVNYRGNRPKTRANATVELFNLDDDLGETTNLAGKHRDRTSAMYKELEAWYLDTQKTATRQPSQQSRVGATAEAETPQWSARIAAVDPGSQDEAWAKPGFDDSGWKTMKLPGHFEKAGLPGHDGVVWFRKTLELTAEQAKTAKPMLGLGQIDDMDVTWVNGKRVGGYEVPGHYYTVRNYEVPAGTLQAGENTITVRVMDHRAVGGIAGKPEQLALRLGDATISLANEWKMAPGANLAQLKAATRKALPGNIGNAGKGIGPR